MCGAQGSPFATIDDSVWDEKYSERYGVLDFGVSSLQGPRETMEDCAYVVPRARCGFLFAGDSSFHPIPLNLDMKPCLYLVT